MLLLLPIEEQKKKVLKAAYQTCSRVLLLLPNKGSQQDK